MYFLSKQRLDEVLKTIVCSICLGIVVSNCGCESSGTPHPVDPDLARNTLQTVLLSWKEGHSIEPWQQNSADIVVQDMDWMTGATLLDFEILDEGKSIDANLHCQVRLTFSEGEAKSSEKTVTYLVTTNPKRTVFRQVIP